MIRFLIASLGIGGFCSCGGPKAGFKGPDDYRNAPVTLHFTNESSQAEKYFWDCGNGETSDNIITDCHYFSSGRYEVTLKAIKGKDTSLARKEIVVFPPHDCLIVMATNFGRVVFRLFNETPLHRDQFIKLAESGFYEGISFHRLIPGFVIQGGDPSTKKRQSGYTEQMNAGIPAEFHTRAFHTKGALAAARTNDEINPKKESSPSQFYIVLGRPVNEEQLSIFAGQKNVYYNSEISEKYRTLGGCPQLDMEYTVFGEVIEGMENIEAMSLIPTDAGDRPKSEIIIEKMIIVK